MLKRQFFFGADTATVAETLEAALARSTASTPKPLTCSKSEIHHSKRRCPKHKQEGNMGIAYL
jgi:hypothetical protein